MEQEKDFLRVPVEVRVTGGKLLQKQSAKVVGHGVRMRTSKHVHTRLQSQDPFMTSSCSFILTMFALVQTAGLIPRSMAAFSAGRPNASQPMGNMT